MKKFELPKFPKFSKTEQVIGIAIAVILIITLVGPQLAKGLAIGFMLVLCLLAAYAVGTIAKNFVYGVIVAAVCCILLGSAWLMGWLEPVFEAAQFLGQIGQFMGGCLSALTILGLGIYGFATLTQKRSKGPAPVTNKHHS